MDAHWYALGQGVFKNWVLQPSNIKQAHIASTALLGIPLTVDRDHDRWSCELLLSGSSNVECLHFGPVNGCSTMHTPPFNPNPGSHTPYIAPWHQRAFWCPLHFSGR